MPSKTNASLNEIWFRLIKDEQGYPDSQDWEELWGAGEHEAYEIMSIPVFENRVSLGDTVSVTKNSDGLLEFSSVLRRGGHSTFRLWVDTNKVKIPEVLLELKRLGARCETTLERFVAVDVASDELDQVEKFLIAGANQSKWDLQDGYVFPNPV